MPLAAGTRGACEERPLPAPRLQAWWRVPLLPACGARMNSSEHPARGYKERRLTEHQLQSTPAERSIFASSRSREASPASPVPLAYSRCEA